MSEEERSWENLIRLEDWWAIWLAAILIISVALGLLARVPEIGNWTTYPLEAFPGGLILPLLLFLLGIGFLMMLAIWAMRGMWRSYFSAFLVVFFLAILAFFFSHQASMRYWGIGYAIWALAIGLLIANTVGTPRWLLTGARSELYIKTGLVLLGAEILFSKILQLGGPGLIVAWVVTPTVIIFMWFYGTRGLKLQSKPLVIIIAAATSVCGVSAAIATAAACRAKKEELTLAVGMTMIFTVLMMIGMPALATVAGLSPSVGGAWLGGTIDSTGAVVAAGALLGENAEKIAAVVKMIQNILIGFVAFLVALFWVTRVDRNSEASKPSLMEVWYRFPKFILGFVLASVVFSFILLPILGDLRVSEILDQTKVLRSWFFCLAFVSIGLESNFKDLASQLVGGKPIILYIVGQSFNIVLTLLMAWLAFGGVLFDPVF